MTSNLLGTIRKASLSLSRLATISIILFSASPAKAGITITQTTCPIVIDQPGTYFLAADVGPCASGVDGIEISASNVTLLLFGHTITGSAAGTCNTSFGIFVSTPGPVPLTNVNVLGSGTISNFFKGFEAANATNSSVKFVKATIDCSTFAEGFEIDGPGGHWTVLGNVVQGPGATSVGIILFEINNSTIVLNNVDNSFAIFDSSNNIIVNNTASNNFGGIFLGTITSGSNNNQIHGNTTSNNVGNPGLQIFAGSGGNNISGNKSFNNVPDMEDDNPNCGTNRWQGNHFNTASQPCIH